MRKKGFEPNLSISVLLTVPDSGTHKLIANSYLKENFADFQPIFLNEDEENLPISLIRELISQVSFSRTNKEKTAYVLCGVENASLPAQNALLKILEEPPQNILLVLVSTVGNQILPTIRSRCVEVLIGDQQAKNELEGYLKETLDFCIDPKKLTFHELISLAEQWKKDEQKQKNLTLVLTALLKESPNSTFALEKLREALDSWKKNGNVKLVIEHCFLTIKKHYLTQKSISKT